MTASVLASRDEPLCGCAVRDAAPPRGPRKAARPSPRRLAAVHHMSKGAWHRHSRDTERFARLSKCGTKTPLTMLRGLSTAVYSSPRNGDHSERHELTVHAGPTERLGRHIAKISRKNVGTWSSALIERNARSPTRTTLPGRASRTGVALPRRLAPLLLTPVARSAGASRHQAAEGPSPSESPSLVRARRSRRSRVGRSHSQQWSRW